MRYESVIWDWNGTLLDDIDVCVEVANEILEEHDLPMLSIDRYREIFDFPVTAYWERAGMDLSRVDFETLSNRFCRQFERRLHRMPLFDAARDVLELIRERGHEQFVLSNTEQTALIDMLEEKQVRHLFADARGRRDSLAHGKTGVGARLISDHALVPARTLMLGDTLHDLEVAEELGIDCVLVSTGHHSHRRLQASGATVISSLDAVASVLWRDRERSEQLS